MVAALLEVHHDGDERHILSVGLCVQSFEVASEDQFVDLLLEWLHVHLYDELRF